ncbi:MAG: ABC transporter permease [Actinobacteria bacterium]|nr:ABC transporter permease [Actinomycetota bacterium]
MRRLSGFIYFEKRLNTPRASVFIITVLSVFLSLVLGGVFLSVTGHDPIEIYSKMFSGVFGSSFGLSETLVRAIPLMILGLGISVAFRMQLWNIGAEGQIYMGAFAASWVPLTFPHLPTYIMLPAMITAAMLAGGLWALIPAIPRAYLGVNEIITTLMLNYVAILWVEYLVFGPWRDPQGFNFPLSAPFPEAARLGSLGGSRVHGGILFALVIAVIIYIIINRTRWGYEIKVIGESEAAARYAGMDIRRNILLVMLLSGAICGLAGMSEVSGISGRLQHGVSPGYGYTAIIVAWLAKLNPFVIIVAAILFGGLQVGGYMVQSSGISAAVATMLQGAILFFVLGGEVFNRYRIRLGRREAP